MATVSFQKDISLSRHSFQDVNEFFVYYLENYSIDDEKVEVWILKEEEVTQNLREKIKQAKSWKIKFVNI